jgi:regulatory protein
VYSLKCRQFSEVGRKVGLNQETLNNGQLQKRVNKAIAYACRVLGVREYSEKLLRQKLATKGYEPSEADRVVVFLLENNWLSDQRYCESFIRSKIGRGQGLSRIRFEVREKGIDDELFRHCLAQQEIDWQQLCDQVAFKKAEQMGLLNDVKFTFDEKCKAQQKLERFLTYRGFTAEQCRASSRQIK